MKVRFKKLHPAASAPEYAHGPEEDAGMDVRSVENVTIPPGEWRTVSTGLAVELKSGFEIQVRSRSGLARKFGVSVLNAPGTVDPGYRGDLGVILINHGDYPFDVKVGDRIAQIVVSRYEPAEMIETEGDLDESARGAGGFGHTGVGDFSARGSIPGTLSCFNPYTE